MEPEDGLFIPKKALPREYWEAFLHIAKANGLTPKELICKMIVAEVNDIHELRQPILGQIMNKIGVLIEKKMKIKNLQ